MDEDELDFESLLDAALGIQQEATADPAPNQQKATQQGSKQPAYGFKQSSSVVSYDQVSPSPSPAASPVHFVQYPAPCSPCLSSSSMQMHASLQDSDQASAGQQQLEDHPGMYSPVRESGSPPPDHCSPARLPEQFDDVQQQWGRQELQHLLLPQQQQRQLLLDFSALPREVQMRVLCFLSADALTTLAQTCKHFSVMCSEPVLWRRLFCFRWGKKGRQQNQLTWKARYMERDVTELRAAAGGGGAAWAGAAAGDAMQDMFVQAHIARRQQSLPRAAVDDLMLVEDDEVAARVLAWRKSRGFDAGQQAQPERPADIGQHSPGTDSGHRPGMASRGPGFARRASGQRPQISGQQDSGSSSSTAVAAAAAAAASGGGGASGGSALRCPGRPAAAVAAQAVQLDHDNQGSLSLAHQMVGGGSSSSSSRPAGVKQLGGCGASSAGVKRPRQRRRWTQIGNVFCDEMTGWVHMCDETCSEKIIEPSSGLLVCPISGQVSDRMMTCAEEEAEEGDRGDEDGKAGQDEDYGGERGRLARAFAAGYYCSNERELMRTCGVRLSR